MSSRFFLPFVSATFLLLSPAAGPAFAAEIFPIGVARADVTPDYAVRLSGYGSRREETSEIVQRIWAKALAFGSDAEGPAILITVDNCGISAELRRAVLERIARVTPVTNERFTIASSHTHAAPMVAGVLPNLFGQDIPPAHQQNIDRYTRELAGHLEQVALAALADRQPGRLAWASGEAGFAKNRRQPPGGPVDQQLPVLRVTAPDGKLRALLANYACHCTTISFNQISGDWAGYAQEYLERDHPGAIALISIGCGADQNPNPRGSHELAQQHGQEIATEVKRLLAGTWTPIAGKLECRSRSIQLPFDTLPTRDEWEKKAADTRAPVAYHAKKNLARLDRGESLPTSLPYQVQTWNFGRELAMVFLPGEVVVDYSLRLKRELDPARLWVTGYANDVPCYIPSRRILQEGGYEGANAMVYYDRPTRFADEIEELIVSAVLDLVPKSFQPGRTQASTPPPLSPAQGLASLRIKPELAVELVAAEPLVIDPVAIDFGTDGKLWVAEMHDYPSGLDGNWKPGGRIKFLDDTDGDGKYDQSTLFLDGIPFPTGVMPWRQGALVCAAPDILYAEDTNGDGRADVVRKLFSGFETENYQARVNGLVYGLDNWVYGANGLRGGVIRGVAGGREVDIRGRDFRMHPDTEIFEPAAGLSQQGRVRDDWGNWFGCDNSHLLWHFPLPDHYARRNPHVVFPGARVGVPAGRDPNQLFPASVPLERFNRPEHVNRVTSACGLGIYRDDWLGAEFYGDAFICESVHNLVARLKLTPQNATFAGHRAPEEQKSEFLASTDPWFRPVQVGTGPDGALYVVDMYRYVIEHPRWIPEDHLAKLEVRAGDDKGRIYRVVPRGKPLRPPLELTRLKTAEVAAALDSANGIRRDLAQRELAHRADPSAAVPLRQIFQTSARPAVRVQALAALDAVQALTPHLLRIALRDPQAEVRAQAIRLCEPFLGDLAPNAPPSSVKTSADEIEALKQALLKLVHDPEFSVRYQLALTLGEWNDPRAGTALSELARVDAGDQWMSAAILSSASRYAVEIAQAVLAWTSIHADTLSPSAGERGGQLIALSAAVEKPERLGPILNALAPAAGERAAPWQLVALGKLQDGLERRRLSLATLAKSPAAELAPAVKRIQSIFESAPALARDPAASEAAREAAIRLLGRGFTPANQDLELFTFLLRPEQPPRVQQAAIERLRRLRGPEVAERLLADWSRQSPSLRELILETLLSREEWAEALLANLQNGTITRAEIPGAAQARLLRHGNASIQQRAAKLLASSRDPGRAEVLARFQPAAELSGDAGRGSGVFGNLCASCHAFGGQGHEVGPDLMAFRNKSAQDFLLAILDPNSIVEPRFITYHVETRDERSLSGIISSENASSITLVQGGGARETILRTDIAQLRASELSLMPEGLEQNLTPQDLADLIAYLRQAP